MGDFAIIDEILLPWAETNGLHVYKGHKQNVVRSLTVYVWLGTRHESLGHIWLDAPNELGLIGVHAAHGAFRFDEAVKADNLAAALDTACARLAEQERAVAV